jgi:hypothetical protein
MKNLVALYEVQLLILPTRTPSRLEIPTYMVTIEFLTFLIGEASPERGF